ncbi:hypothetical protein HPB50_015219 [Hyalomma asiaticum]|uniref:Uncharacterized protein n=1 Tax=Hyalomma asiaticum TaxID=266040 RepID=A0ACB7SR89_HYAAI|nr:hypothetical protein HPB50_015219 [Hyalomma asiaticum]
MGNGRRSRGTRKQERLSSARQTRRAAEDGRERRLPTKRTRVSHAAPDPTTTDRRVKALSTAVLPKERARARAILRRFAAGRRRASANAGHICRFSPPASFRAPARSQDAGGGEPY